MSSIDELLSVRADGKVKISKINGIGSAGSFDQGFILAKKCTEIDVDTRDLFGTRLDVGKIITDGSTAGGIGLANSVVIRVARGETGGEILENLGQLLGIGGTRSLYIADKGKA